MPANTPLARLVEAHVAANRIIAGEPRGDGAPRACAAWLAAETQPARLRVAWIDADGIVRAGRAEIDDPAQIRGLDLDTVGTLCRNAAGVAAPAPADDWGDAAWGDDEGCGETPDVAAPALALEVDSDVVGTLRLFVALGDPPELPGALSDMFIEQARNGAVPGLDGVRINLPLEARQHFADTEAARLQAAGVPGLSDHLDEAALAALAASDGWGAREYAFYRTPGETGERYRQAASVYPPLAGVIASPLKRAIHRAIAEGQPLEPVLEERLGIPKAMLRRLQKVKWRAGLPLDRLTTFLNAVPPDWMPKDKAGWDALCDVAALSDAMRTASREPVDGLIRSCAGRWTEFRERLVTAAIDAANAAPNEDEESRRQREALLAELREDSLAMRAALVNAVGSVQDMAKAFSDRVILPMIAYQIAQGDDETPVILPERHLARAETKAAGILFGGKAMPDILEMARKWSYQEHHMAAEIARVIREEEERLEAMRLEAAGIRDQVEQMRDQVRRAARRVDNVSWLSLTDEKQVRAPNGIVIEWLTSWEDLQKESEGEEYYYREIAGTPIPDGVPVGRGMDHCVGRHTYVRDNALQSNHHICSMRRVNDDGSFERLSTCEIGNLRRRELPSVIQHYGVRNSAVPKAARDAFEWMSGEIAAGRIPVDFAALERARVERGGQRARLEAEMQRLQDEANGIAARVNAAEAERQAREQARLELLRSGRNPVEERCGYDWHDARNIASAWNTWGRARTSQYGEQIPAILGKKWRKMGAHGLVTSPEVMTIAREINPLAGVSLDPVALEGNQPAAPEENQAQPAEPNDTPQP